MSSHKWHNKKREEFASYRKVDPSPYFSAVLLGCLFKNVAGTVCIEQLDPLKFFTPDDIMVWIFGE